MRAEVDESVWRLATGCSVGVRFPAGAGNSSLLCRPRIGSGAHPVSYPMDRDRADHSSPSSANVKSAWRCASAPRH
jgi:hypothetical protein